MAKLVKQFKIYSNTTQQTYACDMYTTLDEVSNKGLPVEVDIDGVPTTCYVALGKVGDANATPCHILKTTWGNDEWVLKTTAVVPYNEVSYTTAGTYTLSIPTNKARVALCAGGGGGAGAAIKSPSSSYTGGTGGNTIFGTYYTVTGGTGGYANKSGSCSAGKGGTPNGRNGTTKSRVSGHSTTTSGGAGWALNFNQASGSYGAGGGATASSSISWLGGGGSGGYYTGTLDITPGDTSITVGTYGVLGDTDDSRAHGYNGAAGFAIIAYGGDIG